MDRSQNRANTDLFLLGARATIEWFWRGARIRHNCESALLVWKACAGHRRRARVSADLAARARDPLFDVDGAEEVSCELYRESLYWSLRALERSVGGTGAPSAAAGEPGPADLVSTWRRADHDLLKSVGRPDDIDWFDRTVLDLPFPAFSEVAPAERSHWATRLCGLAESLIKYNEEPYFQLRRAWRERIARLGAFVAVTTCLWLALTMYRDWSDDRKDLSRGRPWRASSLFEQGCASPAQSCEEQHGFFFHTREEENPWVEFDLGQSKSFSEVRVVNRTDCCRERALPLVVEVSNDDVQWKTVDVRKGGFVTWKTRFPTAQARWVRLRVAGKAMFHLRSVRILP